MSKRILYFITAVLLLFAVSYFLHTYILKMQEVVLPYSLLSMYLFHVIATSLVYIILEFIADTLPNEAGYVYLASMLLKIGFFVLIFKNDVFTEVKLIQPARISLVVPLFLFLTTEAMGVFKLLNNK
ncbi:DUF6168 family protein [Tenacibaculum piscium]|uniref:DUF6168 family protein n=1 Tax=Tenacibaculum piscium TaxID=1458515 RepID=UPI001F405092|nr:DUF6168 family protein [Tenacibaculum piscium]